MLKDNLFFKPTALYKEYMILDLIEKNPHITQREMSEMIGIAVSMVNSYLDQYEQDKLIVRKKHSTKTVEYFVTKKGKDRKKVLNISYLSASLTIYNSAKNDVSNFLNQILQKGFKNILLYGAGEVAEILLQSLLIDPNTSINILAVIDDDENKQGKVLVNKSIIALNDISGYVHDGILISSYTHQKTIKDKLAAINYKPEKILHFFE